MGPTDDASSREMELRSATASLAALGLALSCVAGAMLWVVFSFPVGAAEDIGVKAVGVLACRDALRSSLAATPPETPSSAAPNAGTTPPAAGTTASTLPPICAALSDGDSSQNPPARP